MADIDDTKESTYKTRIKDGYFVSFLKSRYGKEVGNINPLKGGEISQAFTFDTPDGGYVIRVNRHGTDGFKKDNYAYLNFNSETVPVPKIIDIGQIDDTYSFALAKRADGASMKSIIQEARREKKLAPDFVPLCLETLDAIHAIDISNTSGFGAWKDDGQANKSSWKEFIMSIGKEGWWAEMFKTTFLEEGLYTSLYERLGQLIEFCPEQRYLIHGDFGLNNILFDGQKVVGVTDWSDSKYGDFVYDAAWLSFWPSEYDFTTLCIKHYAKKVVINYEKRLLCYQIHIALTMLSFFAKSIQKEKYDWTKHRIEELMRIGRAY